jgi:hypothetical protein
MRRTSFPFWQIVAFFVTFLLRFENDAVVTLAQTSERTMYHLMHVNFSDHAGIVRTYMCSLAGSSHEDDWFPHELLLRSDAVRKSQVDLISSQGINPLAHTRSREVPSCLKYRHLLLTYSIDTLPSKTINCFPTHTQDTVYVESPIHSKAWSCYCISRIVLASYYPLSSCASPLVVGCVS